MAVNIGPRIGIDGEKEFRTQLNNIISDTKRLKTEYKALESQFKDGKGTLKQNREAHKMLSDALKEQEKRLDMCKSALKTANEKFGEGSTQSKRWSEAVAKATIETEKLKKQLEQIPSPMKQIGEAMKSSGDKISKVGSALTKTVTAPLVAIGVAGVKSFADVDKTMQLATKTMNATGEEATALGNAMKTAAANSTYGMDDAANATLNFARAGLDATQAANALAPAMNLAAGEGGNLDTVSGGLVATINSFGDSFENAEHYADVFATACNNSALDVDSLSSSMSTAAPVFATAGYAVEDAALYMGVMANKGIGANEAATSLKTGLARLVSPAKEGSEMMAKLGISVTNADGSMKDSITVQSELHAAFSTLSESEQIAAASAIFGKQQMDKWLALINTAPSDVNALAESLGDCKGASDEMAESMMSGFGGSLDKLKSALEVLVYTIGEKLAPYIQKVTDFIQGLVDKFNALTPAQQETIVKIGLIVAAIGPLLLAVGKIVVGIGNLLVAVDKIKGAFVAVKGIGMVGSMGKLATSILPVIKGFGSLVAAIGPYLLIAAAVVGVGYAIYKNWDEISAAAVRTGQKVQTAWTKTKEVVVKSQEEQVKAQMAATDAQVEAYRALGNGIKNAATSAVNAQTTAQQQTMLGYQKMGEGIANTFNTIKTNIGNALTQQAQMQAESSAATVAAYNAMGQGISRTWASIKSMANSGWGYVKNAASIGVSSFQNSLAQLWSGAQNLINRAVNGFRSMIERIKALFHFSWEWPKLKLPHFSFDGKFSLNPPSVPHLKVDWYAKAMGSGMILNSPTIFGEQNGKLLGAGEAGPEVIVGADSLFGMIARAVEAGLGTPGGTVSNSTYGDTIINVYGSEGQSVRELAREVGDILLGDYRRASVVWS